MSSINVENQSKSRRFLCNNSKFHGHAGPKPLTTLCNRDKIATSWRTSLLSGQAVDQAKCPTSGTSPCKNRGIRGCGGIGRLIGFRFQRASVQVRVLSSAPNCNPESEQTDSGLVSRRSKDVIRWMSIKMNHLMKFGSVG